MNRSARGITLIELIVFVIIVSVGLAGVLAVFDTSVKGSASPLVRKQALVIAEAMLQEVMQKSYENDPADPGNTSATLGCTPNTTPIACHANTSVERSNYNDVDDYNGFSKTGITQLDGTTPVTGLSAYSVSVSVTSTTLGTPAVNAKRIDVTASGGGEVITLTGYRTNYE